ncbi:glycoside hydrolase family 92 protein [Cohnella xylanilytica]|uniref:Glycoside hydrolase family 92 protein n=1 Tax=Cohnella xylanilytica TaxID=557555 RepID=A0A841U6X0_9BACL|nr:GH92 family glycosyl hydrolase [Cohnella xylanilytica]MBB6694023.1 glycoside hydrolase family 92 protein [Cohnella xylanilytica]
MNTRPTAWVDPFIGTESPGHCLIGPYLPYSIVRLGPDSIRPQPSNGYEIAKPIRRFSHTHVSGTGGGGRYGNVGLLPFGGLPRFEAESTGKEGEAASAGYYTVKLAPWNIEVELTSTPRVGVHRYRFPAGETANLLIDVGSVVQVGADHPGEDTGYSTGGFCEFVSETELIGRGDFRGGWGHKFPYSVYFYAKFDAPATSRLVRNAAGMFPKLAVDGPNCMAVAHFGDIPELNVQVGISYVSIAKARENVERETAGRGFDDIRASAAAEWDRYLSRIEVEGGTEEQRKLFYTLFTRLVCMPSDLGVDDENAFWKSGKRHFTDFYALWDSVRNANSLISLFDPKLHVDMLNCLLDIADHIGWIPDAWIQGHSAMIQGGSSADILLSEAAQKGFAGIDYEKALLQMRKNNEVESPDPWLYGRHLCEYRDNGYLSTNIRKNCVSRHMEYAYQDWCIGHLAERLGQTDVAETYYESSRKLWNLWREDIRFFAPKHPNGEWANPFEPGKCYADSWNDPYFYEGTSWQWSFSAHHDFAGLVERHGGAEAFVRHLDRFFEEGHFYPKETMLHVPYLYHYAGRPDRSADRVREILAARYRPELGGLPDNEDMGCQSAFYLCGAIGLYPVMGQDLYLLSAPLFRRTAIRLGEDGGELVIETEGADPGADGVRIAAATLNGAPLDRAWVRHAEIAGAGGAVLRLTLAASPSDWGAGEERVPPSPLRELRNRSRSRIESEVGSGSGQ